MVQCFLLHPVKGMEMRFCADIVEILHCASVVED